MIVGDTHGDDTFVSNLHRIAREEEVDTIIQLGDFGYNFDRNLIASIAAWLSRDPEHKWYWLDGNHDHHDYIEQVILKDQSWDEPVNMGGMTFPSLGKLTFPDRMYYLPRGSVFTVGEKRCMALGGAFSIDRAYRKFAVSWWEQEMLRVSDIDRAIKNGSFGHPDGSIDVMFTHDAPPSDWLMEQLATNGYKVGPESHQNRIMLSHAVNSVSPKHLYHGHYHWRYDAPYTTDDGFTVRVHGVAANVMGGWMDPTAKAGFNFLIKEW